MANKVKLNIALAGNPNSGKSTIFNALTGANQHVGNYPGVTVEKKEGVKSYKNYDINFIDLPGTYSLSAYSDDEVVARDYIINEKPDMVVHIADASNLERNLYLFTQLNELDIPLTIALNMTDILEAKGQSADAKELSGLLGVPVIETVGSKGKGIADLLDCIIENVEKKAETKRAKVDYGEDIKEETDKITALIEKSPELASLPKEWLSIKLLDNDPAALKKAFAAENGAEILAQNEKSRAHIQQHFGEPAETEIAERRYGFANAIVKTVIKEKETDKRDISAVIDKFALNRLLGLPIFALVMYIIFKFTFSFSTPVVGWLETFFERFGKAAANVIAEGPVQSLIVDGIIGGVGGLLGFFPLVLFMFFAIAFFEDSGYMARAAFVMDKFMSKFGLHGKSFLPLMISTNGCAVPGIMATRTLDSKRDRIITMMVVPFMICGAKLPIFALLIGAFFDQKYQANVMFLFYVLSVILALCAAKVLSLTALKGEPAHFVMELPPYHLPTLKGLFLKMWERGWLYIRKAGTIVVFLSIVIWAGFTYPKAEAGADLSEAAVAAVQVENSFLGKIGAVIEPLVKPIGMDGSRAVALIAGLAAKEVVVSSLGTIYSLGEVDPEDAAPLAEKIKSDPDWSPLKGVTFLIFCLIYLPCIVAVTVFFKESGSSVKWLGILFAGTTVLAYLMSFLVYQTGTLLKIGTGG